MTRHPFCLFIIFLFVLFSSCKQHSTKINEPLHPEPIGFDEDEISKMREKYFALIHTAPPNVDWKKIEAANVERNIILKKSKNLLRKSSTLAQETFANGQLAGTWSERGSDNQAGSIIGCDYDSVNNSLYVVSAGGSIWKNNGLVVNNWQLINDNYLFNSGFIKIVNKLNGGLRIIAQINTQVSYSDDDGANFNPSGITFPVAWGGNSVKQIVHIKGTNNVYLLCYIWDNVSWSPRVALYRSVNEGTSFSRIYTFNHGNITMVKMMIPYNSNEIYLLDGQSSAGNLEVSQVTGNNVTLLNSVAQPQVLANDLQFSGVVSGSSLTLYFLNDNKNIFTSTNLGASWMFKGTLPQSAWSRLDVSNIDPLKVFSGGVEAMRSYNSGTTWSVVNTWGQYYGNIMGKLHADIMNIVHYRKTDGSTFAIINNHGGVAISYDELTTTNNLSVTGLHSAQYYDILTALDNPNVIYGGTQDQGLHRTATALNPGLLNFNQAISGDYGYLVLADIYRTLYAQYPGGTYYLFDNTSGGYMTTWTMPGTQKPNYGWMLPAKNTYNPISDTILMAGGNITGGAGSYLCRINILHSAPYTVSTSQYNYNFRANSNNGTSGISAIENSPAQPEKLYVATEDGTFFYSNNAGTSWNKSSTFSVGGGWYLYGSTIYSSRLTNNLVWYGGSGYAGTAVFKSVDGGASFAPMSNGLPQTLVHEIVPNLTESMLFAATDAGPYVYVVDDDMWYPMIGADNPIQSYTAVEFISATNTARFATYGRGIFDFDITEPVTYYFFGNGNWSDPDNWINQLVPPAMLSGKHEVFINPNGECILNVNQTISNGAKVTVVKDKKFTIKGSLKQQ